MSPLFRLNWQSLKIEPSKNNILNRKSIGPVVATSLLLVVAVVSLVSFQSWYNNFGSNLVSNAEIKGTGIDSLIIQDVVGDVVYVKSSKEINLTKIQFGGRDCELNPQLEIGINQIDIGNCGGNISTNTPEVVLVAGTRVLSKKVFKQDRGVPIWVIVENFGSTGKDTFWGSDSLSDGGYALVGQFVNSSNEIYEVRKVDSKGKLEWQYQIIGETQSGAIEVITLSDNSIISSGKITQNGVSSFIVLKLDSEGNQLWNYSIYNSSNHIRSIIKDSSEENLYLVSNNFVDNGLSLFLHLNSNTGNEIFNRTIVNSDSASQYFARSISHSQTSGNFIVVGSKEISANSQFNIMEMNGSFGELWNVSSGGSGSDFFDSVIKSEFSQDYYAVGVIRNADSDMFIQKVNSTGSNIWNDTLTFASGSEYSNNVLEANDGSIVGVGYRNSNPYLGAIYKYNSSGSRLWNKTYQHINGQWNLFNAIHKTADSGFIVTGYRNNVDQDEAIAVKVDSNGDTCSTNLSACSGFR